VSHLANFMCIKSYLCSAVHLACNCAHQQSTPSG